MAEPARLTGALLARKGHAVPTGGFAHAKLDLVPPQPLAARSGQRCRGAPSPAPSPLPDVTSPLAKQPRRRPGRAARDRVALTLRLDRERYTRLKVLAALRGCSGQDILISALDAYLDACATDHARMRRPARRGKG